MLAASPGVFVPALISGEAKMSRQRWSVEILAMVAVVAVTAWPEFTHAADPTLMNLTVEKSVLMRGFYMGTKGEVTLSAAAPTGGTTVTLQAHPDLGIPNGVKVPAGQTKQKFDVFEKTSASTSRNYTTADVRAKLGSTTKTVNIELRPFALNVTATPGEVVGGTPVAGKVTVGTVAPGAVGTASTVVTPMAVPSNTTITLTSDNAAVTVPASVTVNRDASSATFNIETKGVTFPANVRVTGEAKGWSHIGWLNVKRPTLKTLTLSSGQITSGSKATATLTMDGSASSNGIVIISTVQTNHPQGRTVASVPNSFTIPAGQSSATFDVVTAYSDVDVTATVRAGKQSTVGNEPDLVASLTVKAAQPAAGVSLTGISLSPTSVVGGQPVTATVTLAQASPSGGVQLMLRTTSRGGRGSAPGSLTIPAGQSQASFTVNTEPYGGNEPGDLLVIAEYSVNNSRSASVSIQPTALDSVSFGLVPWGATPLTGTVKLNGPAPQGGTQVTLATSNSTLLAVPGSLTVPAGAASAAFTATATPGSSDQIVTVSATRGQVTKSTTVTVGPPRAFVPR
jgi:hypothetical protein